MIDKNERGIVKLRFWKVFSKTIKRNKYLSILNFE
jgi:hypothetical protein